MNKRVHYNNPGEAHELTFSCYRNRPFLRNHGYCMSLADAIEMTRKRHNLKVWGYVFMPNHVHLLIYPTLPSYSMATVLQSIKQSVSRRVIIAAKKSNSSELRKFQTSCKTRPFRFWQSGGGYDRNIVSRFALMKAIDYIHSNPVRAGLVNSPGDYEWSSYCDWYNLGRGRIEIGGEDIPLT